LKELRALDEQIVRLREELSNSMLTMERLEGEVLVAHAEGKKLEGFHDMKPEA